MRFVSTVTALFLIAVPAAAQAGDPERDRKLQEKVDALARRVEEATGVKLASKIPAAYQGRDEFARLVREKIAKEYPPEKIEADTRLYKLLGLVPEDFDFMKTVVDLMRTQAGAYYDPETKRMYVLWGQLPESMLDAFLFHELVHAVQDHEHDLARTMKALESAKNGDAVGGFRFLVEGEASFWMQVHMLKSMGQGVEMLDLALGAMNGLTTKGMAQLMESQAAMLGDAMPEMKEAAEQLKKIPPILIRTLMDPYLRGMYAAHRIHKQKGREGFRALFREPPAWNTRDFMFADDWIRSPRGVASVALAPLGGAFGGGWRKITEDTIGALTLHVMFEDHKREADAVAMGWDGDRVQVWQDGRRSAVVGVLAFASEGAAATFAKQLEHLYREQWTKGGRIEEGPGGEVRLSCGEDRFWVRAVGNVAAFYRGAVPGDGRALSAALQKSEVAEPRPVPERR